MFKKLRNTLIATSVLYLLFGLVMLFLPSVVIKSVCYLVGIMFLFVGVSGAVMYMKTELKTAFTIGFVIYLPFLVIDIVVSSVLVSMGMMFLPPTMIALPFKLIMFVMVDGWYLVVKSLVESFAR